MKSFAVAALRAGEFDAFRLGVRERANLRVADIANRSCRTRWRTAAARCGAPVYQPCLSTLIEGYNARRWYTLKSTPSSDPPHRLFFIGREQSRLSPRPAFSFSFDCKIGAK
jgi:hypothetical protein